MPFVKEYKLFITKNNQLILKSLKVLKNFVPDAIPVNFSEIYGDNKFKTDVSYYDVNS